MDNRDEAAIQRMQANLAVIRKVGGWTTAQFGEEIGVTRQTVSNLEKGRTPLSKTQYLAIRAVLIHEIGSKGNEGLAQVVRALVDEPLEELADEVDSEEPEPTKSAMEDMAMMTRLLSNAELMCELGRILGPMAKPIFPAVVFAATRHMRVK